jgi:predicted nuclease of predicted toxin-antitoxin system
MRFLADAGVSPKTIEFLKQFGHEATHVRSLGLQRAPDAELVERAHTDHVSSSRSIWTLVTF